MLLTSMEAVRKANCRNARHGARSRRFPVGDASTSRRHFPAYRWYDPRVSRPRTLRSDTFSSRLRRANQEFKAGLQRALGFPPTRGFPCTRSSLGLNDAPRASAGCVGASHKLTTDTMTLRGTRSTPTRGSATPISALRKRWYFLALALGAFGARCHVGLVSAGRPIALLRILG